MKMLEYITNNKSEIISALFLSILLSIFIIWPLSGYWEIINGKLYWFDYQTSWRRFGLIGKIISIVFSFIFIYIVKTGIQKENKAEKERIAVRESKKPKQDSYLDDHIGLNHIFKSQKKAHYITYETNNISMNKKPLYQYIINAYAFIVTLFLVFIISETSTGTYIAKCKFERTTNKTVGHSPYILNLTMTKFVDIEYTTNLWRESFIINSITELDEVYAYEGYAEGRYYDSYKNKQLGFFFHGPYGVPKTLYIEVKENLKNYNNSSLIELIKYNCK